MAAKHCHPSKEALQILKKMFRINDNGHVGDREGGFMLRRCAECDAENGHLVTEMVALINAAYHRGEQF